MRPARRKDCFRGLHWGLHATRSEGRSRSSEFLMCPFCVRALVSSSTTGKYTGRAESSLASRPDSDDELRCRCITALVCRRAGHSSPPEPEAASRSRSARHRKRAVDIVAGGDGEPDADGLRPSRCAYGLPASPAQGRGSHVELEPGHAEGSPPRLGPVAPASRRCSELALDRTAPDAPA
jgi:hypothetical protein